jgi:aspartate/methionine/tyrosine aminotransferase
MDLPPFLLNEWLEGHGPVRFNLAGSTGPLWTLADLLRVGEEPPTLDALSLSYSPPRGNAELRAAVAVHHEVDPDWVIITNGASEAIALVLIALWVKRGKALLPFPAYPAFAGIARATHLEPTYYRLDRTAGFTLDPQQVAKLADVDTIVVAANSPHNPTGALLRVEECATLTAALAEKGVPLLVDEVFHPIYFETGNRSAAGLGNVIVIGDMSKAFSMPGLRVGWIIDADPARRERISTARSYLSLGGSPIVEALALHALKNRAVILERTSSTARANLASLDRFMADSGDVLDWVRPQAGMLAFPWFRDGRESRSFCLRLLRKDVLVSPGDCFGMPEHMRVGFGSQTQGIDAALEIIAHELRSNKN